MRSLCTWLAGAVLGGALVCLASGCGGGGPSSLEKPPEAKKVDPMTDMPGYKEMQEKMKTKKKSR